MGISRLDTRLDRRIEVDYDGPDRNVYIIVSDTGTDKAISTVLSPDQVEALVHMLTNGRNPNEIPKPGDLVRLRKDFYGISKGALARVGKSEDSPDFSDWTREKFLDSSYIYVVWLDPRANMAADGGYSPDRFEIIEEHDLTDEDRLLVLTKALHG